MLFPTCDLDQFVLTPYTTWAMLLARAAQFSTHLDHPRETGRVALQLENHRDLFALIIAIWTTDNTAVLLHPRFPDTWCDALHDDVGWDRLITADEFETWSQMESPSDRAQEPLEFDDDKIATVLFTSGSRGLPKGVAHAFAAHQQSARGSNERLPFEPGDTWLVTLPICHVGGLSLLFRAADGGGALVMPEFDTLEQSVAGQLPTHLSLVPTQLKRVIRDAEARDVARDLKVLLVGGGPVSDDLFGMCEALRVSVRQTYGMTETASQVCTGRRLENDCGTALAGRSVTIEDGEICVSGATLGRGYFQSAEIVPFVDAQGRFFTGDLGSFDERGNLRVAGRRDNMFVRGGENVQPETIEQEILALGFDEVIVVPVDDATFGSSPVAFVDRDVTSAERKKIEERLPRFMWPIDYLPFPESTGLKRSRTELRTLALKTRSFPEAP